MDKKICITGASKGIGLAEAQLLSKDYELYLHASKMASFDNITIPNSTLFGYDFTKIENVDLFVEDLKQKTSSLDVLVNNAGLMFIEKFSDFQDNDIHTLITLNLHAQLLVTKKTNSSITKK